MHFWPNSIVKQDIGRIQTKKSDVDKRLRILIVEDNSTDAELLQYLLGSRFPSSTEYIEAGSLTEAAKLLERLHFDCIILDLNLPDSTGDATFQTLTKQYPFIPIVVMTHNKDRQLALRMVREGAADYLLKDFRDIDENIEQVYSRIAFAIERHRRFVRVSEQDAEVLHRAEKASMSMLNAHKSGQHKAVQEDNVEAVKALVELAQNLFAQVKQVSQEVSRTSTYKSNESDHIVKAVDNLERELIRGYSNRPGMRSQVDLIEHRLASLENRHNSLKHSFEEYEGAQQRETIEVTKTRITSRTKLIIGVLSFIGALVTAAITYESTRKKNPPLPAAPPPSAIEETK